MNNGPQTIDYSLWPIAYKSFFTNNRPYHPRTVASYTFSTLTLHTKQAMDYGPWTIDCEAKRSAYHPIP
ncbi:hypothetical protein SAMN04488505_101741 [Chitinophaga rupis]|uniref:Uncharacterized protein n=1 Tax=Chitinophaga rupis TaxID=573321 RepID=A0A1H7J825_9BACT|nr:hypothetical protein SAMN04488505_101741 [Chitinophaga rupis]